MGAKRKGPTSYGSERGNKAGDPVEAGKKSADARLIRMRQRQLYARNLSKVEKALNSQDTERQEWAMEHLARYGIGIKQDVTSDDKPLNGDERAARLDAIFHALTGRVRTNADR